MFRVYTSRMSESMGQAGGGAGRVFQYASRQPSWVMRLAVTVGLFAMLAVALVLIVPAVLIGIVVFVVASLVNSVKRLLTGGSSGRTPSDSQAGRRNVRVRLPGDQ